MHRFTSKPNTNTINSLVDSYMEKQGRKSRAELQKKKKKMVPNKQGTYNSPIIKSKVQGLLIL